MAVPVARETAVSDAAMPRTADAELRLVHNARDVSESFFRSPVGQAFYWIIGLVGILFAVLIMASAVRAETLRLQGAGGRAVEIELRNVNFGSGAVPAAKLRDVASVLNGSYAYDGTSKIITITADGKTAKFMINSDRYAIAKRGMAQVTGKLAKKVVLFRGAAYIEKSSLRTFIRQFHHAAFKPLPGALLQSIPIPIRPDARPETMPPAVATPSAVVPANRTAPAAPSDSKLAPFIRSIVIDAGHGAHDPGAIGPGGTKEKDINLDVALKIEKHLAPLTAGRISLTRRTDNFLSLKERVEYAKRARADIFIAVHSNSMGSSRGRSATGTEVYFFSSPSDNEARLAERIEGGPFDPKAEGIDPVLWDLMVSGNVVESHKLAESVSRILPGAVGLPNRGVKSARFYVMYYGVVSNIPSILIELGYVSNPTEEAKLADPEWRDKAAAAIASAIAEYLKDLEERYPGGRGWSK